MVDESVRGKWFRVSGIFVIDVYVVREQDARDQVLATLGGKAGEVQIVYVDRLRESMDNRVYGRW